MPVRMFRRTIVGTACCWTNVTGRPCSSPFANSWTASNRLRPRPRARDRDPPHLVGPLARDSTVVVIQVAPVRHDRWLMGEGLIDAAGRPDIDDDAVSFDWMKQIFSDHKQVARLALRTETVIKNRPTVVIPHRARIAGEAVVPTPTPSVTDDRISRVACPGAQVARTRHAGLLAPALFRQRLRLRVVDQIIRAAVFDETCFIETAVLPLGAIFWTQAGRVECPVKQVVRPAQPDPCRSSLITGIRIRVVRTQETAVDLLQLAGRAHVIVAQDPRHRDVITRHLRGGLSPQNHAKLSPTHHIFGRSQAGLVADSVPAHVAHVERAVMLEDKRHIDGLTVKCGHVARGRQDQLSILVWRLQRPRGGDVGLGIALPRQNRRQRTTNGGRGTSGKKSTTRDRREYHPFPLPGFFDHVERNAAKGSIERSAYA